MLNEAELRRPEFQAGRPVVLADGQIWTLPLVRSFFAAADNEKGYELNYEVDAVPAYADLVNQLDTATSFNEQVSREMAIAKSLVLANYDLDAAALRLLLRFAYHPDANPVAYAVREVVMAAAFGLPAPTSQSAE